MRNYYLAAEIQIPIRSRDMKTRMPFILILSFLISALIACGGEVHFTNGKSAAVTSPPHAPNKIEEAFSYKKPAGTQIVVFLFDPKKSNRKIRERTADFFATFSQRFLSLSDQMSEIHFLASR